MQKVSGIKNVDFLVTASGYGVVNNNGTTPVRGPDGKEIKNHTMPKLRGYTNENGDIKEDNGYKFKKLATEIDFAENPMYISQNCIRNHLFGDESHDFHFASKKDSGKDPKHLLLSISGLLRGFVVPGKTSFKRTSPLLLEDFVDQLGNGNFEQFANGGAKDSNSIFSKTTFGETKYLAHGSLSVESLQFISLDGKFDRACLAIANKKEGIALAKEVTEFLKELGTGSGLNPVAEFGEYSRIGSIYDELEVGILLNDDGVRVLVDLMIEMVEELGFKQAKGWMSVDNVLVDYNDSKTMMRVKKKPDEINEDINGAFAVYYKKAE